MASRGFKDLLLSPNLAEGKLPNQGIDIGGMAIKGLNIFNDILKNGEQLTITLANLMNRVNQIRGQPEFKQQIAVRQEKLQGNTSPVIPPSNGGGNPVEINSAKKQDPDQIFKWYKDSVVLVRSLEGNMTLDRFIIFLDKNKEDIKKTIANGLEKNI